jgi:hypothetical protein
MGGTNMHHQLESQSDAEKIHMVGKGSMDLIRS